MENITNIIERNLWLIGTVASWTAYTLFALTVIIQVIKKVGA